MKKTTREQKRKKSERPISFRESAAKAFPDVLRKAAKNKQEVALSLHGKIVVIDAGALRNILAHAQNGNGVEDQILQHVHAKHR